MEVRLHEAAQSSAILFKFVEQSLPQILAGHDFSAARKALALLPYARDKKFVLCSVATHLESAEARFQNYLEGENRYYYAKIMLFLLAIRASIYTLAEEHECVEQMFEKSLEIKELFKREGAQQSEAFLSKYVNSVLENDTKKIEDMSPQEVVISISTGAAAGTIMVGIFASCPIHYSLAAIDRAWLRTTELYGEAELFDVSLFWKNIGSFGSLSAVTEDYCSMESRFQNWLKDVNKDFERTSDKFFNNVNMLFRKFR